MGRYLKLFILLVIFISGVKANDIKIDKISEKTVRQDKHVMIFFHMTYCPYCKKMIKKTFKAKNISKQLKKYFTFIDINKSDAGTVYYKDFIGSKKDFAKSLDVHIYPTIIFLDNNQIAHKVVGYRNKNKFVEILKYITTKSYRKMDFESFLVELELYSEN